ncbi:uncharacterized protein A4U43_C07F31760 [Asparagus officinalis]|uniref:Uncharacterized protein n=1 Tax=Asparagus officinalis TaxID=4686 RepID=A0A5P1EGC2_ASPOF|nr:uncharacterized protein A4U43_C07F31760 [Asparagus officinalis]
MLHFMYGFPQIDDQMPEDMFPESTLPKNPEDGPSEEAFVETDPVEPAVRPTTSTDTSTAVTPPLPPVTQGEEGLSSRLHVLVKELLSDNDPEKIVICIEIRSFFSFVNTMIGKLFHGGLFLHQFKPFLDPRINSIRDAGYPDLAKAIVDDLDCVEHELQMFRELRDAGASSFIAAHLDVRLQTWRDTRIFAELEIQVQRDRVDRVAAKLAIRSSSLNKLDFSINSCETKIDQLHRELCEEEETLSGSSDMGFTREADEREREGCDADLERMVKAEEEMPQCGATVAAGERRRDSAGAASESGPGSELEFR